MLNLGQFNHMTQWEDNFGTKPNDSAIRKESIFRTITIKPASWFASTMCSSQTIYLAHRLDLQPDWTTGQGGMRGRTNQWCSEAQWCSKACDSSVHIIAPVGLPRGQKTGQVQLKFHGRLSCPSSPVDLSISLAVQGGPQVVWQPSQRREWCSKACDSSVQIIAPVGLPRGQKTGQVQLKFHGRLSCPSSPVNLSISLAVLSISLFLLTLNPDQN